MPATGALRQPTRNLVIAAAAVPLALAALADNLRVRRQLDAARRDPLSGLPGRPDLFAEKAQRVPGYAGFRKSPSFVTDSVRA
ncbi:hypothetical protein ACIQFZ_30780 [Streptomyces sp. NPDC093064]|uniref:hypothetical protein n=1 Tax=Streptomyces sp. NPDC093064 TaxID=3366020 RepID=UPI0037F74A3F